MSEANDMENPNRVADHDGVEFLEPVRKPASQSRAMRAGVVAGSALLVVVGATAAMGASPAPSTNADPAASAVPGANSVPGVKDGTGDRPGMGGDRGWFGRMGFRDISITAINGSDVSLATDDGWSRTISVGTDVTLTKGGATITVGDLAVGDQVRVAQDRATDGTYTVTALAVVLPHVGGQVTAVDGNTITVSHPDATMATIHVDGTTAYTVGGVDGVDGTLADVAVGSFVMAEGTLRDDGSLDATSVRTGSGDHGGRGPGFRRGHGGPGDHDDDSDSGSPVSPAPSDSAS